MFEKFGEFDSYEELNTAAAAQKEEGDFQAIYDIAEENGLDRNDAEDFINGDVPQFCNPLMAAYGKLAIEEKDLKAPQNIMQDWINYIRVVCDEEITAGKEDFCLAVRSKSKSLKGCLAVLLKWSFDKQWTVDKDIIKAADIDASKVTLGIPDMTTAKRLIREYYGGK
ncbi:MAG: hypothetical protein IJ608_02730 [Lachnospiraceae bacterium]|nr:hypothetical protein [Lachnospiraceae bacterium]